MVHIADLPRCLSPTHGMLAAPEGDSAATLNHIKSFSHMQVAFDGSLRCGCTACGRWQAFTRGRLQGAPPLRQYEVFTTELIRHLAQYIR